MFAALHDCAESGKEKLLDFFDAMCVFRDLTCMIYYKLGVKKAANSLIDGLI